MISMDTWNQLLSLGLLSLYTEWLESVPSCITVKGMAFIDHDTLTHSHRPICVAMQNTPGTEQCSSCNYGSCCQPTRKRSLPTYRGSEGSDVVIEEEEASDSALLPQWDSSVLGRLELSPLNGRASVLKRSILHWNAWHPSTLRLSRQVSGPATIKASRCTLPRYKWKCRIKRNWCPPTAPPPLSSSMNIHKTAN